MNAAINFPQVNLNAKSFADELEEAYSEMRWRMEWLQTLHTQSNIMTDRGLDHEAEVLYQVTGELVRLWDKDYEAKISIVDKKIGQFYDQKASTTVEIKISAPKAE